MLLRAGLWAFAGKGGHQVINFVLVIVLARLLTPEAFGIVAAAQVILVLSQVVVNFGLGAALIQTDSLSRRMEGTALTLMLGTALIMATGIFFATPWLARVMNVPELIDIMPAMQITFLLSAATNPGMSLLMREMRFKLIAVIDLTTFALINAVVAVSLALAGWSYWALILASLASTAGQAAIVWWIRPIRPTLKMQSDEVRMLTGFGGSLFLAQLGTNAAQRIDNVIVSSAFGAAALGIYSRAFMLMELSNTIFGAAFRDVLFTAFSKFRRNEEPSVSIEDTFLNAHAVAAFVVLPLSALMWAFSEEIIVILMGPQWREAAPLLEIFAIGMLFRLGYKVSGSFLLAMGKPLELAILNGLYATMVLIGAYVGSHSGMSGVAWGVTVALVIHHSVLLKRCEAFHKASMVQVIMAISPFVLSAIPATLIAVALYSRFEPEGIVMQAIATGLAGLLLGILYMLSVRVILANWGAFFIPSIAMLPVRFKRLLGKPVRK